ncbi:hypothetical protein [Pseudomonas putida]|uniref:hypothetical protein n=2 Tax=Pseudomonas TaxID=286 RepID=UPI00064CBAA5|nr:hypothetical protein [Pseudomonas putida]
MNISEPEALRDQFIEAYRRLLLAEGMNIQECRFEWCEGGFVHRETAVAWWAWQASRKSVLVCLPGKAYASQGFVQPSFNDAIDQCRAAILDHGLSVLG